MRDKAMALRPDVVLVFTQNDVGDLARRRPMIEVMRDNSKLKSVPIVGPAVRVLQRSAIFNRMLPGAAWVRIRLLTTKASQPPGETLELWPRYRTQLEEFAALVRVHRARMPLAAWPSDIQIAGTAPATPQEILSGYSNELSIPYLDLTPTMLALQAEGVAAFLTPLDWHPTPEGHEAAARAVDRAGLPRGPALRLV